MNEQKALVDFLKDFAEEVKKNSDAVNGVLEAVVKKEAELAARLEILEISIFGRANISVEERERREKEKKKRFSEAMMKKIKDNKENLK